MKVSLTSHYCRNQWKSNVISLRVTCCSDSALSLINRVHDIHSVMINCSLKSKRQPGAQQREITDFCIHWSYQTQLRLRTTMFTNLNLRFLCKRLICQYSFIYYKQSLILHVVTRLPLYKPTNRRISDGRYGWIIRKLL